MDPVVTEVEAIAEPIAGPDTAQHFRGRVIEHVVIAEVNVWEAHDVAAGQLEVVQVRVVPAREGDIDRVRELRKRVPRPDEEHATGRRIALAVEPREQLDPDRQPRARHDASATGSPVSMTRRVRRRSSACGSGSLRCRRPGRVLHIRRMLPIWPQAGARRPRR